MTRTEKLLRAAQASQRMASEGEARPAPRVDAGADGFRVELTHGQLAATGASLDTALSALLHKARAEAAGRLKVAQAAADAERLAVAAIDAALASTDD